MQPREAIRIVRHPRARRLRLRFDLTTGEAILTLPRRASQADAARFLAEQKDWLEAQRARMAPAVPFAPGIVLSVLGSDVALTHAPAQRGGAVWSDDGLVIGGPLQSFSRRVRDAIKARTLADFSVQAAELSSRLDLRAPEIRLRDTRSRWGSCTAQGHIQLSWRLAFAPGDVARYVIAHEVAHRRELNHSPRFWGLVEHLVGDSRVQRRWLVQEGYKLLRLGVAELPQTRELQPETGILQLLRV